MQVVEGVIRNVDWRRSPNKGTPGLELTVQTPYGALTGTIWLSKSHPGFARQQLKACGFDPDTYSLVDLTNGNFELIGRTVFCQLREENGEYVIDRFIPEPAPIDNDELMVLTQLIRNAKSRERRRRRGEALPPVAEENAPSDDEGVPF